MRFHFCHRMERDTHTHARPSHVMQIHMISSHFSDMFTLVCVRLCEQQNRDWQFTSSMRFSKHDLLEIYITSENDNMQ